MRVLAFSLLISLIKLCASKSVDPPVSDQDASLSFDILHVNDIHAHFDPLNAYNGRCRPDQETCYGGFPRMVKAIEDIRSGLQNSLFMNAGDYYQGSIWYSHFKYEVVLNFAKDLNYDVMSLGNHEFDDDLSGIQPFVDGANFPVLACNIRKKEDQTAVFEPSTIHEGFGKKVGIIGYVSTSTPTITNPNVGRNLEFTDEVDCIREEALKLQNQGVDIIVALGHSGYEIDLKIAKEVKEIDIVVGGHSHTFLYPTGETPPLENEKVEGDYPTYVTQEGGRVVPVVQAYCFSKYLGQFRLNFDDEGELLKPVEGKGVSLAKVHLLDGVEDPQMVEKMKPFKEELKQYYEVVGQANVELRGSFMAESNLGNLVTDSMVYASKKKYGIAFVNNGGLRSNIGKGEITLEDVVTTLPFKNKVEIIQIYGKNIKKVFENIASKWGNNTYSTFLQVSASVRLEFIIKKDNAGSRLASFKVKCDDGAWCELEDEKIYEVILPSFIAQGGFEGPNFGDFVISKVDLGKTDDEVLLKYVKDKSPISVSLDDRITITNTASQIILSSSLLAIIFILKYVA